MAGNIDQLTPSGTLHSFQSYCPRIAISPLWAKNIMKSATSKDTFLTDQNKKHGFGSLQALQLLRKTAASRDHACNLPLLYKTT
eukprot:1157908-Pelagomonas_calceolata.AAC.3